VYVRSSCRGGASAYANSLPNPLISGPQNAGALNDYHRIHGRMAGSFTYPSSPFVAPFPWIPRALSFLFQCPPVYPSPRSVFLTHFPHSFVIPFLPLRPQIRSSSLSVSPTADTERAYACVHVVTTYYYALLLTLAYYYEQWRIDDLSPRPSPREQPRDFF